MATIDQNGRKITKSVKRESDGTWSALVWSGLGTQANPARDVRRVYGYKTRAEARQADISERSYL
jgi:hypothetical protein